MPLPARLAMLQYKRGFGMKNILLCLDFTEISEKVIAYGRQLAKENNAKLTLLHVATAVRDLYIGYNLGSFDVFGTGLPMQLSDDGVKDIIRLELENEHKQLTGYVLKLKEEYQVKGLIRQGLIVETIIDVAKSEEVDLIILGSHGHNPIRKAILGSVSSGVLSHACIPVLVIPHDCCDGWDEAIAEDGKEE